MNSIQADFALIRRYHDAHMDTPFQRQSCECIDRVEAENLRLQQRVNALTKAIHHALDALDDPIFVNNQLWLDPEQTLFHFLEFHLYDRVANGERPLLEIPA